MTKGLLSDVEARAQRRRTRTRNEAWLELVTEAMRRGRVATVPSEARRWYERARRLLPLDPTVAMTLAASRMLDGDLVGARTLFQEVVTGQGTPAAWAGLSTVAHLSGDAAGARVALGGMLQSGVPGERALADAVAGPAGWCGLTPDGLLVTGASPVVARLDGHSCALRPVRGGFRLPDGWRAAQALEVEGPEGALVGSPLPVGLFAGVQGFVEPAGGGLKGWAWHQVNADRPARVQVEGQFGARGLVASVPLKDAPPLTRPRLFSLSAQEVAALGPPLRVTGPDGRHLLGSPITPGLELLAPAWVDAPAGVPCIAAGRPGVDVVMPVYRGLQETLDCVASVLASIPRGTRLIVVDDASPDAALLAALQRLARRRRIVLLRLAANQGFPGAANAGLAAAAGRDVVLLNSDTLVPPGWLERLREAAYAAPEIGTVTPWTNDAVITGYPDPEQGGPMPDLAGTVALDALAQRNGAGVIDLPVGVGFCLYVRRDCLDQVGVLRQDLFAQGYGEENDFCLRARRAGWRNVAARNVFVAHAGSVSFGAARGSLIARNGAILERVHPGYGALVQGHQAADPLLADRRRMDMRRWGEGRLRAAVVFVTHANGGGVERVVAERAAALQPAQRAIIVRPHRMGGGGMAVRLEAPGAPDEVYPNLVFPMPGGLAELARLLRADRPVRVEQHHTLGHHAEIAGLAVSLQVPLEVVVHDYAAFCGRIALVSTERRYCGEPDIAGCEACIADLGSLLEDDPPMRALVAGSDAVLRAAQRVVAPSRDAAQRMARHFPGLSVAVEPWEHGPWALRPQVERAGVCRVVVVGAIGVEKGFEVLLGCARDAKARSLPLEFVVVGFTADDERLMAAGPVFVTGEYEENDAVALIRAQGGRLALIPSVWPETWCFALSRAWEAGLPAAVFDLGAQAERVRATGLGWALPLGLQASGLNDALLRLASDRSASQSARRPTPLM